MSANGNKPEWLTAVDHTADAGIAVEAPDLASLFERAAWGMMSVVTDVATVHPEETMRVRIVAPDRDALLVRWLSELNYLHITERRAFSKFHVVEISETHLEADVSGERIDPQRHTVFTEIKAVTFHELSIEQDGANWRARIIFDL